jgi:hypothetical protein
MKTDIRIQDNLFDGGDRLNEYWESNGLNLLYKKFRRGKDLPKSAIVEIRDAKKVSEKFHLRGFQFGNWVTMEDRYNYLAAVYIALYDLNKILQFTKNNIGLDKRLGVSFGARGKSAALAHYEPSNQIINLTRYKSAAFMDVEKSTRFIYTGGVGSFAHEYGHFLDYVMGMLAEQTTSSAALTNGRSTSTKRIQWPQSMPMRNIVENILMQAVWRDEAKGIKSQYYNRIEKISKGDYWIRRNEIFARLFEQWIGFELKNRSFNNAFLAQNKYSEVAYLRPSELKNIAPLFNQLMIEMRKYT